MKTKKCSKCERIRRLKFFGKDIRYRLGVKGWCKQCEREYSQTPKQKRLHKKRWDDYMKNPKNREKQRIRSRKKYWKNPRKYKDLVYRRQYGVTLEHFEKEVAKQKGRCRLCLRKRRLCPDHNHENNKFRGAICWPCNTLLGHIEATPGLLERLGSYIRRYC